ncbi:MAG: hypothetical protein JXB48_17605, partial [Candidatus Latescibacteria bacterium]|nr:hypothetical protein [Candidatus Latescibacterota bacterium]
MDRRTFMESGVITGGGFLIMKSLTTKKSYAKNDEIIIAVVGINGQGKSHYRCFNAVPGVRVKTICDVDERLFSETEKFAQS